MKRNSILLFLYASFIASVIAGAYLGIIPTTYRYIPFYDSIGHFVLYGILGALLISVFNKKIFEFEGLHIPLGLVIALVAMTTEEILQSFSSIRTFGVTDLFCGVTGVFVFWGILSFIQRKRLLPKVN